MREFDPVKAQFDPSGFVLPHGKQDAAWVGDDAVIDACEWSPGELTASGCPFCDDAYVKHARSPSH